MDEKTRQTVFSSNSDEWETPPWLYEKLDNQFHFTLDPAASDLNHKCEKYYTQADNGLLKSWRGESVFVNPPYSKIGGKSQAEAWVRKAKAEANYLTSIVLLLPARTDTQLWQRVVFPWSRFVIFLDGRLKFIDPLRPDKKQNSAPFPSAVVYFGDPLMKNEVHRNLSSLGHIYWK